MIPIKRSDIPAVLDENAEQWNAEYVAWKASPIGSEPKRYAHPDIREALDNETHSKCAYCEAFIKDVSYTHIEHKLPKGTNPHLCCEWDNLTIACSRCNINKGIFDDPECPLLDPHVDAVDEEIAFWGPFAVGRGGARARMTITEIDLNRKDLLSNRGKLVQQLFDLLELIVRVDHDVALSHALWADVDRLLEDSGEFASAGRYFVRAEQIERGLSRS